MIGKTLPELISMCTDEYLKAELEFLKFKIETVQDEMMLTVTKYETEHMESFVEACGIIDDLLGKSWYDREE